jgi:hypothetical protein
VNTFTDRLVRLADRGPHADPALVVARASAIATDTALADEPTPQRPRWRPLLAAAALAIVVTGGLLVATRLAGEQANAPDGSGPDTAGGTPSPASGDTPLEPVATLPDSEDVSGEVPPTVAGTAPTDWYRLQRDLDVAWYSPNDTTSMLCFRTPTVPASCQPDEFAATAYGGGPIGVATAGDQLIVLTLDPGDTITLATSAGTEVTAPVVRDPQIGWGIARVPLGEGTEFTGLTATYHPPPATTAGSVPAASGPQPSVPAASIRSISSAVEGLRGSGAAD